MSHAGFGSAREFHELFTELGIKDNYAGKIKAKHNWGTGWEAPGVAWLIEMLDGKAVTNTKAKP